MKTTVFCNFEERKEGCKKIYRDEQVELVTSAEKRKISAALQVTQFRLRVALVQIFFNLKLSRGEIVWQSSYALQMVRVWLII